MGLHPLIERSTQRDVRQSKGFREAAAALSGEVLAAEYQQEKTSAPSRSEAGRRHLVAYNARLAAERKAGRDGEHVALALVKRCADRGMGLRLPEDAGFLEPLHVGVALKSAQPDKALGADDPNWGVDKVDLIGVGPDDRLVVVVMKFLAADATRVGTGDTPLRALLEGLSQTAIVDANREAIQRELAAGGERSFSDAPPILVLLGSPRYWELCRKREAQRGAAWIRELERLQGEIDEHIGIPVQFLSVKLDDDPGWTYEDGAPVLTGEAYLKPAWEPGAGRLKPKPKPRSRKSATAPVDEVVEADLSRPVRPYAVTERYTPGDRIEHPTLGMGVVQGAAGPTKIRVLFDDRKSVLVHDRPPSPAVGTPTL